MQKLSSGYKVNSAADDAAGLAISEKMRAQVRGLDMGSKNTQDAVSFVQTADAAMSDIHDMLNRMRELCIQSASDTNEAMDREALQLEVGQIAKEIDEITDRATFNTIYIFKKGSMSDRDFVNNYGLGKVLGENGVAQVVRLNDSFSYAGSNWTTTGRGPYSFDGAYYDDLAGVESALTAYGITGASQMGTVSGLPAPVPPSTTVSGLTSTNNWVELTYNSLGVLTAARVYTGVDNTTTFKTSMSYNAGSTGVKGEQGKTYGSAWLDFSGLGTDYEKEYLYNHGFNTTCATCNNYYSIKLVDGSGRSDMSGGYKYTSGSSPLLEVDISSVTSGADLVDKIMTAVKGTSSFINHYTQYAVDSSEPTKLYMYDNRTSTYPSGGTSTFELSARTNSGDLDEAEEIDRMWIQKGANQGDGMNLEKPLLDNVMLGINGVSVLSQSSASTAIDIVENATNLVSTKRAKMGAYQNRLEHSISVNNISSENLKNAESRIRDVDMAKEMTAFTKNQIISQAGVSVLAQANTEPQNVLQLLQ